MSHRGLSLWFDQVAEDGDPLRPRRPLDGDFDADVCIVGGGLTGLWTAYYLARARPDLRIVVLEARIAGFGASGRNGGWCSALFPVTTGALVRRYGAEAALAMRAAMNDTVREVGDVAAAEEIACDYRRGGTLYLARTTVQRDRARAGVEDDEALGSPDGLTWLSATEAAEQVGVAGVLGAAYTPHCARLQPARLVRGLARVVEGRGVSLFEESPALRLEPGRAVTSTGTVHAKVVVRATEAWTARLPGSRRDVVPVYSLMVATRPLPQSFWDVAGLARGQTFTDERHLIIYGQRTADDRLAFGGRGAPYHFGSTIAPANDRSERVFAKLRLTLRELFPGLSRDDFTHAWGGPLGIPRDWHASVGLDPATGLAWAGGYVGDGLATTNLAGRTLRDLSLRQLGLGAETSLTTLPWVDHRSPQWEPEPLRWLGVNAGLLAMSTADAEERLTRHPSVTARLLAPLLGH
ncbi:NAD(P)/FAD-dependent oxidoreductase [Spongisporangium articulatum]|uniref:NAD(P)/FAD-dependent oxidoreductase n=1 Tax=Spongisporangium articulatum TaxID=3362603 RepID=A0ABW8ANN4_9ACTN